MYYSEMMRALRLPWIFCLLGMWSLSAMAQTTDTDRFVAALRAAAESHVHVPWYKDLEFWKLISSFVGPVIAAVIAWWGAKFLKDLEARQSKSQTLMEKQLEERYFTNQKLIERRLQVFDIAAPLLNDIYCFIRKVGGWKELTPPDVIKAKRKLDQTIYVNAALFSDQFRDSYFSFIGTCFETFVGAAQDARFRSDLAERTLVPGWDPKWAALFNGQRADLQLLERQYQDVMAGFATALGARR